MTILCYHFICHLSYYIIYEIIFILFHMIYIIFEIRTTVLRDISQVLNLIPMIRIVSIKYKIVLYLKETIRPFSVRNYRHGIL
jgi:hypothetical protein